MKIKNGVLLSINKSKDIKNGTFTIPDSVTSIGNHVFDFCSGLTSITIPDNVTSIGRYAFRGCSKLTSIVTPDSVTSIGSMAFAYCSSIQSVTIGNSVTWIGDSVFYGCNRLTKTDNKYYYKAFKADLTCIGFQYEENKWFEYDGEIKLCENGFHACKNTFNLFDYYYGELNKDIVIYKVELEGISDEHGYDSKVVAKRIRLIEKSILIQNC